MKFSTEIIHKIYDDDNGVFIQVGPDADALGLLEIRTVDVDSRKHYGDIRLTLHPIQARRLAEALLSCASDADSGQCTKGN